MSAGRSGGESGRGPVRQRSRQYAGLVKVFVSWSQPLSRAIAEAFVNWLPTVIQECRSPFMSTDIAKGEAWFQAVADELADSKIGVAFITSENHDSPWLHFEGGAMLTKLEKQRICPVVVDMAKTDYDGPLKNLQLTDLTDKSDFFKLLGTINAACENPLEQTVLRDTFDLRWAAFETKVTTASESLKTVDDEPKRVQRSPEEKIDEILEVVREIRSAPRSPRLRTSISAADKARLDELNRRIHEMNDEPGQTWTAPAVAKFKVDHGDVVTDRDSNALLGKILDIKTDGEGVDWVLIQAEDGGATIPKRMEDVNVTPF